MAYRSDPHLFRDKVRTDSEVSWSQTLTGSVMRHSMDVTESWFAVYSLYNLWNVLEHKILIRYNSWRNEWIFEIKTIRTGKIYFSCYKPNVLRSYYQFSSSHAALRSRESSIRLEWGESAVAFQSVRHFAFISLSWVGLLLLSTTATVHSWRRSLRWKVKAPMRVSTA